MQLDTWKWRSMTPPPGANLEALARERRVHVRPAAERVHCPGRKPPIWAAKRPARPWPMQKLSAIQTRFTVESYSLRPLKRPGRGPGQEKPCCSPSAEAAAVGESADAITASGASRMTLQPCGLRRRVGHGVNLRDTIGSFDRPYSSTDTAMVCQIRISGDQS
jgi:hypothetical protein